MQIPRKQKEVLTALQRSSSAAAGLVRRARVILLSAEGVSGQEIGRMVGLSPEQVSRIRTRFRQEGVDGLKERPKSGRKDHAVSQKTVEAILETAMSPPPKGRSRWTTRLLGQKFGLTSGCISDVLRRHKLKPHLSRTYKVSTDPAFMKKVHDVVGLYLQPPKNAIVLSVDEKTSIQALERTQLPLPLREGRARTHTHDYKRHGVVDLYAALEVATGKVTHKVTGSHTARDFLSFMNKVVRAYPNQELHVILDNSSSHNTKAVKQWLTEHPLVKFHFTPTSSSWLNQVEGFFGLFAKQSLSEGNFPSKKSLREHIQAFMKTWNRNPTPFAWTKPADAIIKSHRRMLDRISKAVH